MNAQLSTSKIQRPISLVLVLAVMAAGLACVSGTAQAQSNLTLNLVMTNAAVAGSGTVSGTIMPTTTPQYRLPAPSDFQRLQYWYAAQPNSPRPGAEHDIFTLKPDRTWSGVWNSRVVSRPTRQQLTAITPQQVDLFHRAAVFTTGGWQIATSRTNIPLSALTVTPATYVRLRLIIDRDQALQKYQQLNTAVQALPAGSLTP